MAFKRPELRTWGEIRDIWGAREINAIT